MIKTNYKTNDSSVLSRHENRLNTILSMLESSDLELPKEDVIQRLLLGRLQSSNSLIDRNLESEKVFDAESAEVLNWFDTLAWVSDHVQSEQEMTLDDLLIINAKILGKDPSQHEFRKTNLTLDNFNCFSPELIESLLNDAWAEFINWPTETIFDGVFKSALLYQSILSIHPFENGNGRTARFVLDWNLGLLGLPPVVFKSRSETAIAILPQRPKGPHFEDPMDCVLLGIENTLKILFEKSRTPILQ